MPAARPRRADRPVLRRVTEATRRRFAQLSRQRQGLDGKWESNKKKAAARLARRKTCRLGVLFEDAQAKQLAVQAQSLDAARFKVKELSQVREGSELKELIAQLERLPVTARILQQTMLPRALQQAMRRLPAAAAAGRRLWLRWRDAFRQDLAKAQEAKSCPSAAVRASQVVPSATSGPPAAASAGPAPAASAAEKRPRGASASSSSASESASESSSSSEDEGGEDALVIAVRPAKVPAHTCTPNGPAKKSVQSVATPQSKPHRPVRRQQKITSFLQASVAA